MSNNRPKWTPTHHVTVTEPDEEVRSFPAMVVDDDKAYSEEEWSRGVPSPEVACDNERRWSYQGGRNRVILTKI